MPVSMLLTETVASTCDRSQCAGSKVTVPENSVNFPVTTETYCRTRKVIWEWVTSRVYCSAARPAVLNITTRTQSVPKYESDPRALRSRRLGLRGAIRHHCHQIVKLASQGCWP